jgi:hypothetical protein
MLLVNFRVFDSIVVDVRIFLVLEDYVKKIDFDYSQIFKLGFSFIKDV